MLKDAYSIVKNGIQQKKTYQQVIDKLKTNLTFGVGYLGEYQSNENGSPQSYYVKFSHALAAFFEKADKKGWDEKQENCWRDENITGSEKITVDYKNDIGWAVTMGHSKNGINILLEQVIGLESAWDNKWNSERTVALKNKSLML